LEQLLRVREYYDPGSCAKVNHGEIILVKDRENKDTILVCTEEEGTYSWKTTEGIECCCSQNGGFTKGLPAIRAF
jgi:hypothetical protein